VFTVIPADRIGLKKAVNSTWASSLEMVVELPFKLNSTVGKKQAANAVASPFCNAEATFAGMSTCARKEIEAVMRRKKSNVFFIFLGYQQANQRGSLMVDQRTKIRSFVQ